MKPATEIVPYQGWAQALRLRIAGWELVAPLGVGPRILRFGPVDGPNVFFEKKEQLGQIGGTEWRIYGGHRLWTAPENEQCYAADNDPVSWDELPAAGFRLSGKTSPVWGWQKSLRVTWEKSGLFRIEHQLRNTTGQPLTISPWCLTVLAAGGTAFVPQPPYQPHPSELPAGQKFSMSDFLPNRQLVLWPFTDLTDPRIALHGKCWTLQQRSGSGAFKIGFRHTEGWIGYLLGDLFFAKWIHHDPLASYPDRGANAELFTNGDILEVESLAPDRPLGGGATASHLEWWHIGRVAFPKEDQAAVLDYLKTLPVPAV